VAHGGGRYCKSPGCSFHARFAGLCLQCNSDLTPLDLRNHVMLPLDDVDFSILQVLAKEFTSKRVHIDGLEVWKDEDSSTQVPNVVET
ncbi:hypothetical protein DYB36_013353, partial [Aphanomyces astaci]